MALYSFCVRKKGTDNYVRANTRHELAFLDYFAMRFNDKKELMTFLGADLEKYDDIAITYQSNQKSIILPIYFDAKELDQISGLMVGIDNFNECKNVYEILASAYNNPKRLSFRKVPEVSTIDTIARAALKSDFDEDFFKAKIEEFPDGVDLDDAVIAAISLINLDILKLGNAANNYINVNEFRDQSIEALNTTRKHDIPETANNLQELVKIEEKLSRALDDEQGKKLGITGVRVRQIKDKLEKREEQRRFELFKVELMESYLNVRRSYAHLREMGLFKGERVTKIPPDATMQELCKKLERNSQNKKQSKGFKAPNVCVDFSVRLNGYEKNMFFRCLSKDEEIADAAWEEFMALDRERIEYLKPVLDYIRAARGFQKTIGTMPGTAE